MPSLAGKEIPCRVTVLEHLKGFFRCLNEEEHREVSLAPRFSVFVTYEPGQLHVALQSCPSGRPLTLLSLACHKVTDWDLEEKQSLVVLRSELFLSIDEKTCALHNREHDWSLGHSLASPMVTRWGQVPHCSRRSPKQFCKRPEVSFGSCTQRQAMENGIFAVRFLMGGLYYFTQTSY